MEALVKEEKEEGNRFSKSRRQFAPPFESRRSFPFITFVTAAPFFAHAAAAAAERKLRERNGDIDTDANLLPARSVPLGVAARAFHRRKECSHCSRRCMRFWQRNFPVKLLTVCLE